MIIRKETTGVVFQYFDTETKTFTGQEFFAGDEVACFDDATNQPAKAVKAYLSFDMVQPEELSGSSDHTTGKKVLGPKLNKNNIGKKVLFTYPDYGTSDSYPEYTAHSGQIVTIVGFADSRLYKVKAEDGWEGNAVPDELSIIRKKA